MPEIHQGIIVYIPSYIFIKILRRWPLKSIEDSLSILVGDIDTYSTLRRCQEVDSASHGRYFESKVCGDRKK